LINVIASSYLSLIGAEKTEPFLHTFPSAPAVAAP
jgi:hypothetical protein